VQFEADDEEAEDDAELRETHDARHIADEPNPHGR